MCPGSAEGEGHGAPLQVRTETAAALMCRPVRECVECLQPVLDAVDCGHRTLGFVRCGSVWVRTRPVLFSPDQLRVCTLSGSWRTWRTTLMRCGADSRE